MLGVTETPVTVWHFQAEDSAGAAVYDTVVYEGCFAEGNAASSDAGSRLSQNGLRGFLFPGGNGAVKTVAAGYDRMAIGDFGAYETPLTAAEEAAASVYLITDADRPPRMVGGSFVDWVHVEAVLVV